MSSIKLVFLGDSGVGKTCIVSRYIYGCIPEVAKPTIGAAFMTKLVTLNKANYELLIWDTAGQEVYRGLAPMYYRNANIAIIVYDVTKPDQIESVSYWIDVLRQNVGNSVIIGICGNKTDLECDNMVTNEDVMAHVSGVDAEFMQVSAMNGTGIESMFMRLLRKYTEQTGDVVTKQREKTIEVAEEREGGCC